MTELQAVVAHGAPLMLPEVVPSVWPKFKPCTVTREPLRGVFSQMEVDSTGESMLNPKPPLHVELHVPR